MINLYEFLGIEPTNDVNVITKAINKASLDSKDAKMIQAAKSYLLKPELKEKHDRHFNLSIEQPIIQPSKPKASPKLDNATDSELKSLEMKKNVITFKSSKDKNGEVNFQLVSYGFFIAGLLFLCTAFYKLWFYSKSEYSISGNVNAYVGGDAFNYMINAGQASAYAVICACFWIVAIGLMICEKLSIRQHD